LTAQHAPRSWTLATGTSAVSNCERLAVDHDVIYLTALKPLLSEVATRGGAATLALQLLLLYAVNE
jgi:hypothetical protein